MRKHRIIAVLLICFAVLPSLKAQRLGGGLILGPTFSTMRITGMDSTRFRADFCGGFRIGLIPQHSVFGLELDVIYSRQGMRTKSGLDENGKKVRYAMKTSYVNVPLLLNVYLRRWNADDEDESKMVRLRVGPQIGFCLGGSDVKTVGEKPSKHSIMPWESKSFNRMDYGIAAAVSYWYIELRYTCGLSNVRKTEGTSVNHVISVTWSDLW